MLGAIDHGVVMGCAARKSQKPALEIGGWAGGAQVPCFCLQVCADNGEVCGFEFSDARAVELKCADRGTKFYCGDFDRSVCE